MVELQLQVNDLARDSLSGDTLYAAEVLQIQVTPANDSPQISVLLISRRVRRHGNSAGTVYIQDHDIGNTLLTVDLEASSGSISIPETRSADHC